MSTDADDELVTAYLDGPTELSADERRRIECRLAADPALRHQAEAIRAVVRRARSLAAPGGEPDWADLERQIQRRVGAAMGVPWYRRAWLAPIGMLATATAIALVWLHHAPTAPATARIPVAPASVVAGGAPSAAPAAVPNAGVDELDDDRDALDDSDSAEADAALLPVVDYGWVDELDDQALQRAEHWLGGNKG